MVHKIGCFLTTMILYNVIYLLKTVENNTIKIRNPDINTIRFLFLILLMIVGLIYIIFLLIKNDNNNYEENTKGQSYKIIQIKNRTGELYLGQYSVIILTSLSLPTAPSLIACTIYLIVFATLGTIFVYKNLIYINPILTLCGYNVYDITYIEVKCGQEKTGEKKLTVISRQILNQNDVLLLRNTHSDVIKYYKQENDNESKN